MHHVPTLFADLREALTSKSDPKKGGEEKKVEEAALQLASIIECLVTDIRRIADAAEHANEIELSKKP